MSDNAEKPPVVLGIWLNVAVDEEAVRLTVSLPHDLLLMAGGSENAQALIKVLAEQFKTATGAWVREHLGGDVLATGELSSEPDPKPKGRH